MSIEHQSWAIKKLPVVGPVVGHLALTGSLSPGSTEWRFADVRSAEFDCSQRVGQRRSVPRTHGQFLASSSRRKQVGKALADGLRRAAPTTAATVARFIVGRHENSAARPGGTLSKLHSSEASHCPLRFSPTYPIRSATCTECLPPSSRNNAKVPGGSCEKVPCSISIGQWSASRRTCASRHCAARACRSSA